MKEFSKEIIEIDGKEYTLFLNRKGIVAWEKFCETENKKIAELRQKYANLIDTAEEAPADIDDSTNPFDGLDAIDELEEQQAVITKSFKRLYWIMLYTEHKLPLSEVETLYDKASEEYGENQLISLAQQMIDDASMDKVTKNQELKNLAALRPTK